MDGIKVQTQINTNAILDLKNLIDDLRKESALISKQLKDVLEATDELKHLKKGNLKPITNKKASTQPRVYPFNRIYKA